MKVYFVAPASASFELKKRVCTWHDTVFHGVNRHPWTLARGGTFPSLNNRNRELLHVIRSGRYVPEVWWGCASLVVSESVSDCLRSLGVRFVPVEFDRVVDVNLPRLGDFTWFESASAEAAEYDPEQDLQSRPESRVLRRKLGRYFEILKLNRYECKVPPADLTQVAVDFGSFSTRETATVGLSESLLSKYPIVWCDGIQVREDAFDVLAPHLDLDYFDLARVDLNEEESSSEVDDFVRSLEKDEDQ